MHLGTNNFKKYNMVAEKQKETRVLFKPPSMLLSDAKKPKKQWSRVIPCQINKEFWVTTRILTKLGVFVVPMVLTTNANF